MTNVRRRAERRERTTLWIGIGALLAFGSAAPATHAWAQASPTTEKASPAAEKEEADAKRRFMKDVVDSIDRTLRGPSNTPAAKPNDPNPTPASATQRNPAVREPVDITRMGMSGIWPTWAFPPNCRPILGLPNTGINPLLANVEAGPVRIAVLAEVKGDDNSSIGRNWRDGIELAATIINSAGGLLGRSIEVRTFDAGGPGGGRAAAVEALNSNPFAVLGPVTSAGSSEAMDVLRRVQIPHFVGTRGLEQVRNENPYLFRTTTTLIEEVVQLGTYLRDQRKVRRVAIVSTNNDYGESLRSMMIAGLRFSNISVVQDLRLPPGTKDFRNAVLQVKDRNPEVIVVFMPQTETAKFLVDARGQGLDQPAVVDGLTIGRQFLEVAGPAANGAVGLVGLHANAPVVRVREMAAEFKKAFGYTPSPVGVQGFTAMGMVKAIVDKACSFNGPDFVKASRNMGVEAKAEPGVLMDFSFGSINNVFRDNFLFEIRNQQLSIVATLPVVTLPF